MRVASPISSRVCVYDDGPYPYVVVEISGYNLYDSIDDLLTEHLDDETVDEMFLRSAEKTPAGLDRTEIYLPQRLGVPRVLELLSTLSPQLVSDCERTDDQNAA